MSSKEIKRHWVLIHLSTFTIYSQHRIRFMRKLQIWMKYILQNSY